MRKSLILVLSVIIIIATVGCSTKEQSSVDSNKTNNTTVDELDEKWNAYSKTSIELKDDATQIDGSGASVSGNEIVINQPGVYILTGELTDGSVTVDLTADDNVMILLMTVNITCSYSSPINIQSVKNCTVYLNSNTENSVTDKASYSADSEETTNASIYSKDDLIIEGTGSLSVLSDNNNGIKSKNDINIKSGVITINAATNGIKGKDSVQIENADLNIKSGEDGIKSTNDIDSDKGYVTINSGNITVNSGEDAIQSESILTVSGGTLNIVSGGGNTLAETKNEWNKQQTSTVTTVSKKGLKSSKEVLINGGTISIDSADDSVHTNSNLSVNDGTVNITSGDDGLHADAKLKINNGEINITKSYEGIEALDITVNGGTVKTVSSDDGFNAAGGNDGSSVNGRLGQNSFSSSSTGTLTVNGGYIYVNADGDGLDSNGSITVNGGTVLVNGPTNDGNGPIDCGEESGGEFIINGGTLIAVGSSGMVVTPSASSVQPSFVYCEDTLKANTLIGICDSQGNSLMVFENAKSMQSITFSSDSLQIGEAYSVFTGGDYKGGSQTDGYYTNGTYSSGDKLIDINLSSIVTSLGPRSNFGGGFQPGGKNPGGMGNMRP